MSPVPLPVTNSIQGLQTNTYNVDSAALTTNMANSNNTYKQQTEHNNNSNNNNNNNCNTNIVKTQSVKADTKVTHGKQIKEMPSTAASCSTAPNSSTGPSSVASCSTNITTTVKAETAPASSTTMSAAKNVITSQCDSSSSSSSSSSSGSINNSDCPQSCDTVIKTELESIDSASDNAHEMNDLSDPNDIQLAAMRQRPITLSVVNPHIICSLCFGYLIDATTIVECLHSFCHSCLIKHLRTEQYCPRCEMMINTAKPNIKPDTTLQAIVYKLVPGLYEKELIRKRAFYKDRPEEAALATPEQRGDDTEHLIFSPSDYMSISLEYADIDEHMKSNTEYNELLKPRYLKCPAMCTVAHLKKLVYGKFEINSNRFTIDIMYKVKTIVLLEHYTLMDVAYIYTWKRDAPMRFYFCVKQSLKPLIRVKKNLLSQPKKDVNPNIVAVEEPKLNSRAMCIVHEPTPSIVGSTVGASSDGKMLEPEEIKQENEAEVSSTTEIPTTMPEPVVPKQFEILQPPQSPSVSSHESSPTEKLKITLVNKAVKEKNTLNNGNGDASSPSAKVKLIKEKKEYHKTSPSTLSLPKDERKVENIKLKIDLSKQNSVTIINMSDPERKEIVKPVKPEKEWKVKTKKEKDGSPKSSPKSSPHNERKSKTPSPLTVPPITIKAERISPLAKINTSSVLEEEDKKSQFLKSFALAPIKSIKTEKVESKPIKNSLKEFTHCIINKPTFKDPLQPSSSSKRKSKEPVKTIVKKPKLSPPLATEDFKIKLPPIVNSQPTLLAPANNTNNTNSSNSKTLMPPPPPINAMKPPSILHKKPHKLPQPKVTAAPPGSLTPHPMHNSNNGMQLAPPGSRTPIAKRFQPILPKSPRVNPFANIPSDVNKILKDAGTEIKSIPKEPLSSKVYGPKTDTSSVMGPPPLPAPLPSNKAHNSQTNNVRNGLNNSSLSSGKPTSASSNKSNSYLNLALFNASKSKGNEVPPGCRTPMYTPNSPIYSPSSPQYVPNYNIPTMPTYKYTPKPNSSGNSYLQNVLGATNTQMSNLFPSPPVKKDANSTTNNNHTNSNNISTSSSNSTNNRNELQPPKRVYPFARSPSPVEDPPEKQLKVKSLLNSCNINIPSSLSITITREDGETSTNGATYPKHKSPVNNYIEILKLPDQSSDNTDNIRLSPPIQNTNNSLFPNPPIRRVSTPPPPPPPQAAPPANNGKQNNNQNSNNKIPSPTTNVKPTAPNMGTNINLLSNSKNNNTVSSNKSPTTPAKPPSNNKSPINANDKKTPSPEKRQNSNASEQKSPNSGNSENAVSKKFRHILPRQINKNPTNTTPNDSNLIKPTANVGNVIGTYSSPSGVNVKIHSNTKKVQPAKKSPVNQQSANGPLNKNQQQHSNTIHPPVPNGLKATVKSAQAPKNSNKSSTAQNSLANASATSNKLTSTPNVNTLPATTLTHPIQAMLPPHLAAAGPAELGKFLKENFLRAQVQAAVANQSNMFYPYAANAAAAAAQLGQFNPTMYNYQQAYIMDQLSRMQRAGNEAFSEYMQKLKNSMDANNKTPAELLLAQQQQQHQHTKSMTTAKNVSSPKSSVSGGQNNANLSSSTTAAHNTSATTTPSKEHSYHPPQQQQQQQQQQNQVTKIK